MVNLSASFLVTLVTLAAEMGGVAIALQLATSVHYLLRVPVVGFVLWVVLWRIQFDRLEKIFGGSVVRRAPRPAHRAGKRRDSVKGRVAGGD